MPQFRSFPKIGQFRQIIKNVVNRVRYVGKDEDGNPIFDGTKPIPTLNFK